MIVPVILSGGSGTRLWPLSTPERPKQFLPLTGPQSLFRETISRIADRNSYAPPIVVANAAHEALCLAELEVTPGWRLILEPIARNTAAAIVMAASVAQQEYGPDAVILVMPSDHLIGDAPAFHRAVQTGVAAAQAGRLLTFGIVPSHPETGFGYLKAGAPLPEAPDSYAVARFVEKPDLATASAMLEAGGYFWNGGIFLYSAAAFMAEVEQFAPEVHKAAALAITQAQSDCAIVRPSVSALTGSPDISVDYAVMERSDRVAMVVLDADWSDVGSWDALAAISPEAGNGPITQVQSTNCYVRSDGLKVALLGVDDLIVVAAGDRVVIMKKGRSQDIRQVALAANN